MELHWFIEEWWRIPQVLLLFAFCGYVGVSIAYNLLHPSPLSEEERARQQAQFTRRQPAK